jgi:hypothetical protein
MSRDGFTEEHQNERRVCPPERVPAQSGAYLIPDSHKTYYGTSLYGAGVWSNT